MAQKNLIDNLIDVYLKSQLIDTRMYPEIPGYANPGYGDTMQMEQEGFDDVRLMREQSKMLNKQMEEAMKGPQQVMPNFGDDRTARDMLLKEIKDRSTFFKMAKKQYGLPGYAIPQYGQRLNDETLAYDELMKSIRGNAI